MKIDKVKTEKGKAKIITEEKPWVKPKYQQIIDQDTEHLGNNPPDLEAIYNLLQQIAKDVHEMKVRLLPWK